MDEKSDTVVDGLLRAAFVIFIVLLFAVITRKSMPRNPDPAPTPIPMTSASRRMQRGPACLRETSCLVEGFTCAGTDRICRNHLWQQIECIEGAACGEGATCRDSWRQTLACREGHLLPLVVEASQGKIH